MYRNDNSNYHENYRNQRGHDSRTHKHNRNNYDEGYEENYGNMAGSLSYGLDRHYGPTRADYEHYGYLGSGKNHHRYEDPYNLHSFLDTDQNYNDRNPQHHNPNQYHSHDNRYGQYPGAAGLGDAYGYDEYYDNIRRNKNWKGNRNPQNHYESEFDNYNRNRGAGPHDYDNYGLSRHGERNHRGRFTNPGEFYWQP